MEANTINIATFGDTHGHLRLTLQMCRQWQLHAGVHLDGVLLCGDFGYFPDVSRLDKATKRFAKRDPEELGFAEYFAPGKVVKTDPQMEIILSGSSDDLNTVRCPIVFCHGNHEDFELLDAATRGRSMVAVDRYERVQYLPSGEKTGIAGFGGRRRARGRRHR